MKEVSKNSWWQTPLKFFGNVFGWILMPVAVAFIGGSWIDITLNTKPWFFLIFVIFSFLVSCVGITRQIVRYNLNLKREQIQIEREKQNVNQEQQVQPPRTTINDITSNKR